jgi:hypothetical protein
MAILKYYVRKVFGDTSVIAVLSAFGAALLVCGLTGALDKPSMIAVTYSKWIYVGLGIQIVIGILKPQFIWRLVGVLLFSIVSSALILLAIHAGETFFGT